MMRVICEAGLEEEISLPSKVPGLGSLSARRRERLTLHVGIGVRILYQGGHSAVEGCLSLVLLKIKRNTKLVPLPQHVDVGEGVVEGEVMNVLDLDLQEVIRRPAQPR